MVRAPSRIRFTGGRGPRFSGSGPPSSTRRAAAPRWSPPSARAAIRFFEHFASQLQLAGWTIALEFALLQSEEWEKWAPRLRRFASCIQAKCAMDIISHHQIVLLEKGSQASKSLAESVARVMRRAAAACPSLPSMDIPAADSMIPPSFTAWLQSSPDPPVRSASFTQGPAVKLRNWNPNNLSLSGVICCARAETRIREWRKAKRKSSDSPPPPSLLQAVTHDSVLPTAVASRADHWWSVDLDRWLSVKEVGRAFGLRDTSPLMHALCSLACPASAVAAAGKAIHSSVASKIIYWLKDNNYLPEYIRYASSCSGADFFAEAVDVIFNSRWTYLHAAERDSVPRSLLKLAWGLEDYQIFLDASAEEILYAPDCDLYVISPDCVNFSRRKHGRDANMIALGAITTASLFGFVHAKKAKIVVVENVNEPDGVGAITDIIAEIDGYEWFSQPLDARIHAGVPVNRARRFWIGIRN